MGALGSYEAGKRQNIIIIIIIIIYLFKELIGCQRSCWLPPEIQSNSGSCLPLVFPPGGLVQR
jgi:hypothetical protein